MHMYMYLVLVYKYNSTFMGMYLCVFTFTNICCQHMYMYINGQLTGKDTGLMACWALNEQAVSLPVSLVKWKWKYTAQQTTSQIMQSHKPFILK